MENRILEILSPIESTWSNAVFGKLRVNKARYQKIRDRMIQEKWIKAEKKGRNLLLTRLNFENSKFENTDWTKIARINCDNYLKSLKNNKPLFRIHKRKPPYIKKQQKMGLNAYFHELDRQMIVCTRLVNANALGLIRTSKAKFHQKQCMEFVHEYIKKLLSEHKEFKDEIIEYAQSQVRTVKFKI